MSDRVIAERRVALADWAGIYRETERELIVEARRHGFDPHSYRLEATIPAGSGEVVAQLVEIDRHDIDRPLPFDDRGIL